MKEERVLTLDDYEYGVMVNALNDMRNDLIEEQRPTDAVDDLLIKTIENNFKIVVDKYASIDFFSFIEVVDAIGGIELEVTEEELPYVNDYIREINGILKEDNTDLLSKAGLQQLSGKQALGYARVRYVGTDFARTTRQRKIVELILAKVREMSMSDINDLLDIILPEVTTDFKEKEIFYQLLALPDYLDYDFDSWSIPMKGTYRDMTVRGMQVLAIDFSDNIKELKNRIY
jgi:LCP family protein required for cell wall assembly